ncbi:MAG: HAMP domain-containing histidine kinase [Verrucomicrobiota bacterium]|nr:HAMP domain-containing histidine kinase [Verrucomicrobiota bacterium]
MIARFGLAGFVFGLVYAAFYSAIGHLWGAAIIVVCSLLFAAAPFVMQRTRKLKIAGNALVATMTLGFVGLSSVEGGIRGHAVAWLASVPLCALLLVGKRSARFWVFGSIVGACVFVALELADVPVPTTYDPAWHSLVNSAGYVGLIAFMFILGMIFENGRERAFAKMQDALGELASSNGQLVLLNKEKTEFLGIAAHDLRNPLTTIITYAQILKLQPPDVPAIAAAIGTAGTQMKDLIVNLLEANAIEEGRFTCKIERCDVRELIARSVAQNELSATRKQIVLSVAPGAPVTAAADFSTSVQILENLISNAIKYSPLGTTVRIGTLVANGEALVTVQDEGPGISEEDRQKMFGKFTRLTARPTGGESSTGLGLSIVKKLATAMSGSVECSSELGAGATFTVRLPRWEHEGGG